MVAFGRRLLAEARRQSAVGSESGPVRRLRLALANVSIGAGILTAAYPAYGRFEGWVIAAWAACVAGGLFGVGVYVVRNPWLSRRLGWVALALTVLGVAGLVVLKETG